MAALAAAGPPGAGRGSGRPQSPGASRSGPDPEQADREALIPFARSHANKILRETTDADLKARKWKGEMIVSFNAPVNDMEFQVLFYDVHDGPRRFVDDMSTMVNDRTRRRSSKRSRCRARMFKPNRNMEMVVTVKRAEVGRIKFGVVGEEAKRSGEVTFSDKER